MVAFEINFALQTTILAVVLISMAFRMKGKYLVHLASMAAVVVLGFVVLGIASTLFTDSSYVQTLTNPSLNLATFASHAVLGLSSFVSGVVLVAFLIRDRAVPGRSNLIAKIVTTLWVLAYVVGILFLVILHA